MKRISSIPRKDYRQKIEQLGFDFHADYWKEDSCYVLDTHEVALLEEATVAAYDMYCEAARVWIEEQSEVLLHRLRIPWEVVNSICDSWNRDDLSLYGRFDFLLDASGIPRILEFNADTPTSLLEASVIQWQWKEDCFPAKDQYNGIHEGLVQSWRDMLPPGAAVHFAGVLDHHEDAATLQYLASTAMEAGMSTRVLDINDLDLQQGVFYDPSGERVQHCFKLYPWEWMIHESPDGCMAHIQWIEPIWKVVMSNKAILTKLYELFPDSPFVLPCFADVPYQGCYCRKPIFSREGHNISMVTVERGIETPFIAETSGDYGQEGFVYQQYVEAPSYAGHFPVIGSWVIGGCPAGIGIRDHHTRITDDMSAFVPHIID